MEKKCPYCAETIKAEAIKCRYCFSDLSSTVVVPEVSSSPAAAPEARQTVPEPSSMGEVALRYDAQKKSAGVGYFLWLILGTLGGHRYYFGRTGSGLCMTVSAMFALLLTLTGSESAALFGLVIISVVALWVLVDAFLIPGWTKDFNSNLVNVLKSDPLATNAKGEAHKKPTAMPSEPISISICPQCRSQGEGADEACRRCGHVFA